MFCPCVCKAQIQAGGIPDKWTGSCRHEVRHAARGPHGGHPCYKPASVSFSLHVAQCERCLKTRNPAQPGVSQEHPQCMEPCLLQPEPGGVRIADEQRRRRPRQAPGPVSGQERGDRHLAHPGRHDNGSCGQRKLWASSSSL